MSSDGRFKGLDMMVLTDLKRGIEGASLGNQELYFVTALRLKLYRDPSNELSLPLLYAYLRLQEIMKSR